MYHSSIIPKYPDKYGHKVLPKVQLGHSTKYITVNYMYKYWEIKYLIDQSITEILPYGTWCKDPGWVPFYFRRYSVTGGNISGLLLNPQTKNKWWWIFIECKESGGPEKLHVLFSPCWPNLVEWSNDVLNKSWDNIKIFFRLYLF